jgi:hypothetical protein
MATSTTSKSALQSGAAKDDAVGVNRDFTFTIQDLLANDPGGAAKADVSKQFFFGSTAADQAHQAEYLAAHGIIDNHNGTYSVGADAIVFSYFVQMGNKGSWSVANVDVVDTPDPVPHLSGVELLQNWNFEQDNADTPLHFVSVDKVAGWNNEAGGTTPMEVQHENFGFVTGFAAGEHQWLDTSASPGNIHIGQTLDLATGAHAQLGVSVAAESIDFFNGANTNTYQPDANDHLLFKFNDTVVKDISLMDFTDANGHVDWNHLSEFKVDVTGAAGQDHFEIQSTGMDQYTGADGIVHGYAGFAVDHVSFQEWLI